jgi:squalene cyclase
VRLLQSRQLPTGDWAQESISGVFNKNCMISYRHVCVCVCVHGCEHV